MASDPADLEELDELSTEAVADGGPVLDELSVGELVGLMNERDATIADAVRRVLPDIVAAIGATSERMRSGGRLVYVGAGTSGRLGVLDASEIPPTFGTDPGTVVGLIAGGSAAVVGAVEAAEDDADAGAADLAALDVRAGDAVVGIAASGRTPYVLGALAMARSRGALTVALSCNVGAPLSATADHAIEVSVGPELVAGSTRLGAATATKMVVNMFSTITMIRLGKTYRNLMVDVRTTNAKLERRAIRIVRLVTGTDEDTARHALDDADWNAKVAIAVVSTGMSVGQARAALADAGGFLGLLIDAPAPTDGRGATP
jgi:N-acetylmuramic acid 6-phosphate etherase